MSVIPFFASLSVNRHTTINGVAEQTSSTDYVALIAGAIAAGLGMRALYRARKMTRPKTAKVAMIAIALGVFHFVRGIL